MMLILIVIITFILTLIIIEMIPLFLSSNYTNFPTESLENISFDLESYNKDRSYVENLKDMTGLDFFKKTFFETTEIILDATYYIFFENYDIFLNNNTKLEPNIIYKNKEEDTLYIINYDDSEINIYTD